MSVNHRPVSCKNPCVKRILGTCAVTIAAIGAAGGVWLTGARSALAPEPARVNGNLYGNGWSTTANYITSGGTTTAWYWSGSWSASSIPAGVPCTTRALQAGETATQVIQAYGNYRRCA